jgi:hypothetical protein
MMNKLSVALVAMSLVAVAQPASAQKTCWGVPCDAPPLCFDGRPCPKAPTGDVHSQITIKSIDSQRVFATDGTVLWVPKPKEVSVDGLQVAPEALKPGMVCDVNSGGMITPKNIFTCKSK